MLPYNLNHLIHSSSGYIVYDSLTLNPVKVDDNLEILNQARGVASTEFGGAYTGPNSW